MKAALQSLFLTLAAGVLTTGCVYSHRGAAVGTPEPAIGKTVVVDQPRTTTVVRQPVTTTTRTVVPAGQIVVSQEPPAPRYEVAGKAPDSSHVWVSGYWTYTNNQWVWVPGHWEARPSTGAVWAPGHWEKDPSGRRWIWRPGHWE